MCQVLYYERVEDSGSSAGSSPQESRSTTPKSTAEVITLYCIEGEIWQAFTFGSLVKNC